MRVLWSFIFLIVSPLFLAGGLALIATHLPERLFVPSTPLAVDFSQSVLPLNILAQASQPTTTSPEFRFTEYTQQQVASGVTLAANTYHFFACSNETQTLVSNEVHESLAFVFGYVTSGKEVINSWKNISNVYDGLYFYSSFADQSLRKNGRNLEENQTSSLPADRWVGLYTDTELTFSCKAGLAVPLDEQPVSVPQIIPHF